MQMWTYEQLTGKLINDSGEVIGIGYAGKGEGKNNPAMQSVKDVGPLPCGMYAIHPPTNDNHVGYYALPLVPFKEDEMFGRSAFFIHGDNPAHIGQSSDGCIIMARSVREEVWKSNDRILQVISGNMPFVIDPELSV